MTVVSFRPKPEFGQLYTEYYDRVYKYVYTMLMNREDTEDVVSETFVSAFKHYDDYDPRKSAPGTWLTRIAHNMAVNLVRSGAYRNRVELPEDDRRASGDPGPGDLAEINDQVMRLYSKLSHDEREFLNLRYAMELRDAEVAEILALPVKTVNKRYQRLLKKCREIMCLQAEG